MNNKTNFNFSMKFHCQNDLLKHVGKLKHVKLDKLEMEAKIVLKKLQEFYCDQCSEIFYSSKDLHNHAEIHIKCAKSNISSKENEMKRIKCEFCARKLKQSSDLIADICHCKNDCNNYKEFENNTHKPKLDLKERNGNTRQAEIQKLLKQEYKETDLVSKSKLSVNVNDKKSATINNNCPPLMKPENFTNLRKDVTNSKEIEIPVDNDSNAHFTCGQCPKSFKTLAAMSTHLIDHAGPPYLCLYCPKTFPTHTVRNKHNKTHLAKYDAECSTCFKKFKCQSNLQIHLRVHTGERPYLCKRCGKRFTQSAALYTHTKIHLGLKEHVCSYCNKAFTEYHNMKNHERTHTKERPFLCQYCQRAFSDPSALKRHVRTHTGDKIYPCEQCHMKFTDASGLIAHRRRHTGIKKFICDFCPKHFYTRSELLKHESSVHMDFKRFECEVCRKRFTLKQYLKWHIERNHMRSVRCTICTLKFISNVELEKHRAAGCAKDRFECDLCGVKVPLKIHLKNHMEQKHFQPLYCHICLARFYTDYHLQKHKAKASCLKRLYIEDRNREKENKE